MKPLNRRRRVLAALPAVAFGALILFLSSRPGTELPSTGIPQGDKGLHAFEYLVFGLLLLFPIRDLGRQGRIPVLAVGIVFAAIDEFFQTFIPTRSGDVRDFAMDVVGLLTALLVYLASDIARARKSS